MDNEVTPPRGVLALKSTNDDLVSKPPDGVVENDLLVEAIQEHEIPELLVDESMLVPESVPVPVLETAPLLEPEILPVTDPEATPMLEPEGAQMLKPEGAPLLEPEITPVINPEASSVLEPEGASVVESETAPVSSDEVPVPEPPTKARRRRRSLEAEGAREKTKAYLKDMLSQLVEDLEGPKSSRRLFQINEVASLGQSLMRAVSDVPGQGAVRGPGSSSLIAPYPPAYGGLNYAGVGAQVPGAYIDDEDDDVDFDDTPSEEGGQTIDEATGMPQGSSALSSPSMFFPGSNLETFGAKVIQEGMASVPELVKSFRIPQLTAGIKGAKEAGLMDIAEVLKQELYDLVGIEYTLEADPRKRKTIAEAAVDDFNRHRTKAMDVPSRDAVVAVPVAPISEASSDTLVSNPDISDISANGQQEDA